MACKVSLEFLLRDLLLTKPERLFAGANTYVCEIIGALARHSILIITIVVSLSCDAD
jgi:hypothetical protein